MKWWKIPIWLNLVGYRATTDTRKAPINIISIHHERHGRAFRGLKTTHAKSEVYRFKAHEFVSNKMVGLETGLIQFSGVTNYTNMQAPLFCFDASHSVVLDGKHLIQQTQPVIQWTRIRVKYTLPFPYSISNEFFYDLIVCGNYEHRYFAPLLCVRNRSVFPSLHIQYLHPGDVTFMMNK